MAKKKSTKNKKGGDNRDTFTGANVTTNSNWLKKVMATKVPTGGVDKEKISGMFRNPLTPDEKALLDKNTMNLLTGRESTFSLIDLILFLLDKSELMRTLNENAGTLEIVRESGSDIDARQVALMDQMLSRFLNQIDQILRVVNMNPEQVPYAKAIMALHAILRQRIMKFVLLRQLWFVERLTPEILQVYVDKFNKYCEEEENECKKNPKTLFYWLIKKEFLTQYTNTTVLMLSGIEEIYRQFHVLMACSIWMVMAILIDLTSMRPNLNVCGKLIELLVEAMKKSSNNVRTGGGRKKSSRRKTVKRKPAKKKPTKKKSVKKPAKKTKRKTKN